MSLTDLYQRLKSEVPQGLEAAVGVEFGHIDMEEFLARLDAGEVLGRWWAPTERRWKEHGFASGEDHPEEIDGETVSYQTFERVFFRLYKQTLTSGYWAKECFDPLFIGTDMARLAAVDEDDIGVLTARVKVPRLCADMTDAVRLGYLDEVPWNARELVTANACESRVRSVAEGVQFSELEPSMPYFPILKDKGWMVALDGLPSPRASMVYSNQEEEIRIYDPSRIRVIGTESLSQIRSYFDLEDRLTFPWFDAKREDIHVREPGACLATGEPSSTVEKLSVSEPFIAGITQQLYDYLRMSPEDKGKEMVRLAPWAFKTWLEEDWEEPPEDLIALTEELEDRDGEIDPDELVKVARERRLHVPESLYWEFFDDIHQIEGIHDYGYTLIAFDPDSVSLVRNQWLVHYTNNPWGIIHDGFCGSPYVEELGLTLGGRSQRQKTRCKGGYNFAFTLDEYGSRAHYGDALILFRASGVSVYHMGDNEEQVIFDGATARDMVVIEKCEVDKEAQYGTQWCVGERPEGGPIFASDDFTDVVDWVVDNYEQYKRVLSHG